MDYEFEHLFSPHIFARGEWIAESENIMDFRISSSLIQADVMGTELYEVEIELRDGEVWNMTCTCPYAASGENCKHMAAVLIHAEEGETHHPDQNAIAEVLGRLTKEKLVGFLHEQLVRDAKIRDEFMIRFMSDSIESEDMVNEFLSLIEDHGDRDGFIGYYQARAFFRELDAYVEKLSKMLDQGLFLKTARIIAEIASGFDERPIDDSDGGTSYFYSDLVRLLERILASGDQEAVNFTFEWMNEIMESEDDWYLREQLTDVWSSGFSQEEYQTRQIELLEKKLDLGNSQQVKIERDYGFYKNLITYADLLLERGDEPQKVIQIMELYKTNDEVMEWLIHLAKRIGDSRLELVLIQEGISIAKNIGNRGLKSHYKGMLCKYYQRTDQLEMYLAVLRELAIEDSLGSERWKEYRDQFAGAWLRERDALLQERTADGRLDYGLYEIYADENMLEELMALIEKRGDEFYMDMYYHLLLPKFKDRIVAVYVKRLDYMLIDAGSRNKYKAAISRLRKIGQMPGGSLVMQSKIEEYRNKYKRRPAMMEEMDSAGL